MGVTTRISGGAVRSSNPVLTRLTPETHVGQPSGYGSPYEQAPAPVTYVPEADRMTIDDVVVRMVGLLALVGIAGGLTAFIVQDPVALAGVWITSAIVGLILGLILTFKRVISPPLVIAYAIVEGVFVGAVSKFYESRFDGIVIQAVLVTFGIFFVMAMLFKAKIIRNSPKFAKFMTAAVIGAMVLMVGNLIFYFAFGYSSPLRDGSPLAIGFSLVMIVLASLTFVLDFDLVEQGIRQGAPKSVAWAASFGMLVSLIWVYLEVLRLLSYLRGEE
jgi:uncharacterized YccA/Bax inhibitor family protein